MARVLTAFFSCIFTFGNYAMNEYGEYSEKVYRLQKEIASLESRLGMLNKRYGISVSKRKTLEGKMAVLGEELEAKTTLLERRRKEIERLLGALVANSLGRREGVEFLAADMAVVESLKKRRDTIHIQLAFMEKLQKLFDETEDRHRIFVQTESELTSFVSELEDRKKRQIDRYLEISRIKRTPERFDPPLKNYASLERGEKGVTFKFSGTRRVYATEAGKIIHVGSLSTYGNIVMIDHGGETRSILLGSFDPKVAKGQVVKKNDPVALSNNGGSEGQVYFEVRLKNKVRNTVKLTGIL